MAEQSPKCPLTRLREMLQFWLMVKTAGEVISALAAFRHHMCIQCLNQPSMAPLSRCLFTYFYWFTCYYLNFNKIMNKYIYKLFKDNLLTSFITFSNQKQWILREKSIFCSEVIFHLAVMKQQSQHSSMLLFIVHLKNWNYEEFPTVNFYKNWY